MTIASKQVLAVDCGNTIFHYLIGKPIPGAIASLEKMAKSGRFDEIHLISKIDPFSELFYRFTLWRIGFWKKTGIPKANLHFCRRHTDKAPIAKKLGVTHFVDDRFEVLAALEHVPYRYAFKPRSKEMARFAHALEYVVIVSSWSVLAAMMLA